MLAGLSLKYRIALVIFVLEAIMMTAVLSVTLSESFDSSTQYQKANERVLLNLVSELSSSALLIEEFSDLQDYFEQLIQQPDIVRIQLIDLNGVIVASSEVEEIGSKAVEYSSKPPNYLRSMTVSSPAGKLGSLNMEFTSQRLTEANTQIRNQGITTAIIGMGIIFIVGILAGFVLTRRLDRVTKAAAQFAAGDTGVQSHVSGRDELGNLGSTFDQMVKDVTEKQNLLVAQHRRVQLLMDSTVEGIMGVDVNLECTFVNQACLDMLGYKEDDILSKNIQQLIDLSAVRGNNGNSDITLTNMETDDAMAICSDGRQIPVEFRAHPVKIDNNTVGSVCTFVDISQRKQHEKELALHREHLEELVALRSAKLAEQAQILDQIHDSVISTDLVGNIETWNKGAEKLFGFEAEFALGKHLSFIFPIEEQEYVRNTIINSLQVKGGLDTEIRMMKKNGQIFYAHVSLSMKSNRNNETMGMIMYAMDVSDRRRAEDELHRKSIQLQMANKELESFSYSVSHDLRAPLRTIRGFSQCLSEDYQDKLDNEGQEIVNKIINGTSKMGELIEDMLSLSRVTSYKMKWEEVDLSKLTAEVIKELKDADPDRNVEVSIEDSMIVHGDRHLLRILLVNLISNAWKYSSKIEQATITIGSTVKQNSKVFFIKDNGAGFDMKYADKLFGTFQRLHSADEFEGTGVGLATAARVVHRHHGQIWADSVQGKGATFYFKLSQIDSGSIVTDFYRSS